MEQEFLSIKEFAARAGVTAQAIYKRLNNPKDELCNHLKLDGNKKMLAVAALSLFSQNDDSTSCSTSLSTVEQQLIEMLQAELAAKNSQIERLQDQVAQAHQLLSQEQQLRAVAEQRILLLEGNSDQGAEEAPESDEAEAQVTNKRWWQFWK